MADGKAFAISDYLNEVAEHSNGKRGYHCSGKVGDYTVCLFGNGLYLQGSLAKYYLPSNLYTLTRSDTEKAIQSLCDKLHTDIRAAKVSRLDVSTVLPTTRPPTDYYTGLINKTYFTRVQATKDTLYFNSGKRQLVFYDKSKEAVAKGAIIPDCFKGCNLLRYEMRLQRQIPKQLKVTGVITAERLYNPDFYTTLIGLWKNEFDSIKKIETPKAIMANIKNPKDAEKAFYAMLLNKEQDGQSAIDCFLDDLKAAKVFKDRKYYTRTKERLNKMLQSNGEQQQSELMKELERAIRDIARYAR